MAPETGGTNQSPLVIQPTCGLAVLVSGLSFFRATERTFADVI